MGIMGKQILQRDFQSVFERRRWILRYRYVSEEPESRVSSRNVEFMYAVLSSPSIFESAVRCVEMNGKIAYLDFWMIWSNAISN